METIPLSLSSPISIVPSLSPLSTSDYHMLNSKLQSHVQSFIHSRARPVEQTSAVRVKPTNDDPCLDDYDVLRTLGTGTYATVYLVREKHTSYLYALKAVDKYTQSGRKLASSTVINEQTALTELSGNDFNIPLHASFHDTEYYYLVTDYLPGGDLQNLLAQKELDVEAVRFYMAELLLAIEHVHAHNIIHRDIKPENVFIDTDGHVVLGDFGSAWLFRDCDQKAHFTRGHVGTPAFSAPEVLFGRDYGFEADLWAFGIILYEMLSGREAFIADSVPPHDPTWLHHISEHIKCDEPVFDKGPLMTEDAADLVSQLLRKSPDSRLSDITEIKNHPFFGTIDWISVASRSLTPPWVPRLISTRLLGVRFQEPIVCAGEQYISGDDPLPCFSFRAAPSSLSRACGRRQQVFGVLEGCAPFVSWVDGSTHAGKTTCHTSTQQKSMRTLSRWVMRALNRPVRSA